MFVPAGPDVPMQMPGSPVIRAHPSAACVPPSSWRTDEVADVRMAQRVVERQDRRPGDAEGDADALVLEDADDGLHRVHAGHGASSSGRGGQVFRADAVVGELLDERQQTGVIVAAVALGPQRAEALLHEPGHGERDAVGAARLEGDVEVLVVQVDRGSPA